MISILLPSRGRPENIERLYKSIMLTAVSPADIEIIVRLDDDDESEYKDFPLVKYIKGPRITLSKYWNECYEQSKGDILMHSGDDIIFRTEGWDDVVRNAFEKQPDKILFVFGDDGSPHNGNFGTHGFIHRKWAETVGYFVPPYFSSDYNDTWLNDVAKMLGRHKHIPILTEHMHPDFGKGPLDQTHKDRILRHHRDGVATLYQDKLMERVDDANKLRQKLL